MTANSSGDCVASASTVYNNTFPAWKAFDGDVENRWAMTAADANRWLQLQMPVKLTNIVVAIRNSSATSASNLAAADCDFMGSNDGISWTKIGEMHRNDSSIPKTVAIEKLNNSQSYSYLRIVGTNPGTGSVGRIGNAWIYGTIA